MTARYGSIPSDDTNDEPANNKSAWRRRSSSVLAIFGGLCLLTAVGFVWWNHPHAKSISPETTRASPFLKVKDESNDNFPMPSGVNLGSWLSLEDYFYAGNTAKEVATPFGGAFGAQCLPPLLPHQPWHSETDLLATLIESQGVFRALQIFQAHRTTYIEEADLRDLSTLGVGHVRVPISWCLTDAKYNMLTEDLDDATLLEHFTCPDPYYKSVQWPAIPKSFLEDFLLTCASYNITATLDLHTYPGATSIGTFSGLWPRWPRFWQHDDPTSEKDAGRTLLRNVMEWLEGLHPSALAGLRALSPMNEPAHLSGMLNATLQYVPLLPESLITSYQEELQPSSSGSTFPQGTHLRVLLWLRDAVQAFRDSDLPKLGKELHVNIHESIFHTNNLDANEFLDPGGRHPSATRLIAKWWSATTTAPERRSWAVLDMHHYHAWEPACVGTSIYTKETDYTCSNVSARRDALERCSGWANLYRSLIDKECGPGALLVSAEFSASTFHNVLQSCTDRDSLRDSYLTQLNHAHSSQVELFWWSYKMPYGGAYRSAWSFKQFLYLMGVTSRPDEGPFECGRTN